MKRRVTPPLCQSCAMPMPRPSDHGTDLGGRIDEDYCRFCFREGLFTQPNLSLDGMIDRLVSMSGEMQVSPLEAAERGRRVLPKLKRWRDSTP